MYEALSGLLVHFGILENKCYSLLSRIIMSNNHSACATLTALSCPMKLQERKKCTRKWLHWLHAEAPQTPSCTSSQNYYVAPGTPTACNRSIRESQRVQSQRDSLGRGSVHARNAPSFSLSHETGSAAPEPGTAGHQPF